MSEAKRLAEFLRRQNPHETDEVIKLMNAAANELERIECKVAEATARRCAEIAVADIGRNPWLIFDAIITYADKLKEGKS